MRKLLIATVMMSFTGVAAAAGATTPQDGANPPASGGAGGAVAATQIVEQVTVTNKLIDGKKTWVPSEVKVHPGAKVELTLVNTLPDPHGFNAAGMADKVVVGANETKTVTFTAGKAGETKFNCQLHPAHVGGKIVVR